MVKKCDPVGITPSYGYGDLFVSDSKGRLMSCADARLATYSGFTSLGQPGTASSPRTGGGSVTTETFWSDKIVISWIM
jgi:hypothetical protein